VRQSGLAGLGRSDCHPASARLSATGGGGADLDRNEVGAFLVAAGLGTAAEHALISLLALNGLRVSEAIGADIEDLNTRRGQRVLAITRKGGKKAIAPLAPRAARAIDLAIGERCARLSSSLRRQLARPARRPT
jgi:integrase